MCWFTHAALALWSTASTSITGADPKVRAMAVDVVRAWAAKGYLIVYISSRPLVSRCMPCGTALLCLCLAIHMSLFVASHGYTSVA
jgi:hypothetical protein